MIRAFWSWLTRRPDRREAEPAAPTPREVKRDPTVRRFKAARIDAERSLHRFERRRRQSFVEREFLQGKGAPDG